MEEIIVKIVVALASYVLPLVLQWLKTQQAKKQLADDEQKFSQGDEEAQNRLDNP